MPRALQDRPTIEERHQHLWQAFWLLNSDRGMSFGGPLPIPFSSLDRYAARYGIADIDEFEQLVDVIGTMDSAYLEWAQTDARKVTDAAKRDAGR